MSTVMYATVGLSLAEKTLAHLREKPGLLKGDPLPRNLEEAVDSLEHFGPLAFPDWHRRPLGPFDEDTFPGAEIESLSSWIAAQDPAGRSALKKIVLLATDTPESGKCAECVRDLIGQHLVGPTRPLPSVDVRIERFWLDPSDEAGFGDQVADFLRLLDDLIERARRDGFNRQVLNMTGGYKGLIPFFTMFGFLVDGVEVIYKHERRDTHVTVPALPLTWDVRALAAYRALARHPNQLGEPPPRLRLLYRCERGRWVPSEFGRVLDQLATRDLLARLGPGARLLQRLAPRLRRDLAERIRVWEEAWLPERQEARERGSPARLLELAADLLEPALDRRRDFLTDDELARLIAAIWLHDRADAALTFPVGPFNVPVARFPSLVDRWRHLLAAAAVERDEHLPPGERWETALIVRYAGEELPLGANARGWRDPLFPELQAPPLADAAREIRRRPLPGSTQELGLPPERAVLLAALLRAVAGLGRAAAPGLDPATLGTRWSHLQGRLGLLDDRLHDVSGLAPLCPDEWEAELERLTSMVDERLTGPVLRAGDRGPGEPAGVLADLAGPADQANSRLLAALGRALAREAAGQGSRQHGFRPEERAVLFEILSLLDQMVAAVRQEADLWRRPDVRFAYLAELEPGQVALRVELGAPPRPEAPPPRWQPTGETSEILRSAGLTFA